MHANRQRQYFGLRRTSWGTLLIVLATAQAGFAGDSFQDKLNQWLKDPLKAKNIGKQDGTLYNPVMKPVVNTVIDNPQPVLKYPDPKIADDCEQYRMPEPSAAPPDKVTQEGGPNTLKYQRRTVEWFPRKGQDVVAIPAGVKLRAWRLADGTQFKAAWIRTTGLMYPNEDWTPKKGPNIELVREDGQALAYDAAEFVKEDQDYVRAIHYRELMDRRKKTAEYEKAHGLEYKPCPSNHGKPRSEPNLAWVDTPHCTFTSGDAGTMKPDWGGSGKCWLFSEDFRAWNYDFFEDVWAWYRNLHIATGDKNHLDLRPKDQQLKFAVRLNNAGVPGWEGWAAAGGSEIQLHPGAIRAGFYASGIVHEWGHSMSQGADWPSKGGPGWPTFWEANCNWLAKQFEPIDNPVLASYCETSHAELLAHRHHYGAWPFLECASCNPNFGWMYGLRFLKTAIPTDHSPYMVIMREGEQKAGWENGVKGFGDLIGEMAARHVSWQYRYQKAYQADEQFYPHPQILLESIQDRPGWYRPNWARVPGQYGYNIIRLIPAEGAKSIAVDFQGLFESQKQSDWRVTIVAVDRKDQARYSPTFNKGTQSLDIQPGDRVYLAVAATPLGYYPIDGYSPDCTKPTFPYEVSFQGCRPADKPERGRWMQSKSRTILPSDTTTEVGRQEVEELKKIIGDEKEKIAALEKRMQVIFDRTVIDNEIKWHKARIATFERLIKQADGKRHPNGGGWVASTAHADATAYVGPNAYVLDGAKVTGNARITGHAMIIEQAEVGGNALVGDFAQVEQQSKVMGNAHVVGHSRLARSGLVQGNAMVRGEADVAAHWEPKGKDFGLDEGIAIDSAWLRGDRVYTDGRIAAGDQDLPDPKTDKPGEPLGNNFMFANWDFDFPSEAMLYDSFLFTHGYLRGAPAFAKEGQRTWASFDGQKQYVSLSWDVVAWPELTVDVMLRHQGGDGQRVFDFGTQARYVYLTPKNAQGRLALVQVVDGKTQEIAGPALPPDQWARVRAELSAGQVKLYVDGKLVGSAAAWLAPLALDADDQEAANTIAAGRDGKSFFHGDLDFVRVYTKVHADFALVGDRPPKVFGKIPEIHAPHKFFTKVEQWVKEGGDSNREKNAAK